MIDLIEDYTWADEDCDLLTKNQIEYHKGVRFSDILSEQTCVVIQYSYRFTFQFGIIIWMKCTLYLRTCLKL